MFLLLTLLNGFKKVLRYWQIVLLMVTLQVLAAWLLAAPLASLMHEQWDHSLIGEQLGTQPGLTEAAWDEMLIAGSGSMVGIYRPAFMFAVAVGYVLFSTWMVAGSLSLYNRLDLKFNWDRFWSDATRYFRPFVGLAIIAAILFLAADLISGVVDDLLVDALAKSDDEATIFVTGSLFTSGLRFLLFALIVLVFQYAKVIAAAEQLRNVIYLIRKAFAFVARYFLPTLLLFFLLGLLEFGVNAMDLAVWQYLLPGSNVAVQWIWLLFSTFLLSVVKLSFLSSQLFFYVETRRRDSETGALHVSSMSSFATDYEG